MTRSNERYPHNVGSDGNFRQPDFERCCTRVTSPGARRWHQCTRPRGHGPDEAYCKQHDPDRIKAKREAQSRTRSECWRIQHNMNLPRAWGPRFLVALVQIRDGHKDAKGLARETLEAFEKDKR